MLNKFDLPAYFNRHYYESRYFFHLAKGNKDIAKIWETFYFDNALSFAWCWAFEQAKKTEPKKANELADKCKKDLEKMYK